MNTGLNACTGIEDNDIISHIWSDNWDIASYKINDAVLINIFFLDYPRDQGNYVVINKQRLLIVDSIGTQLMRSNISLGKNSSFFHDLSSPRELMPALSVRRVSVHVFIHVDEDEDAGEKKGVV